MWLPPLNPNANQTKIKQKTSSLLENSKGIATPTPERYARDAKQNQRRKDEKTFLPTHTSTGRREKDKKKKENAESRSLNDSQPKQRRRMETTKVE
jgi:hypothetical protein